MAKVRLGPLSTDLRGKLGNVVYLNWKGHGTTTKFFNAIAFPLAVAIIYTMSSLAGCKKEEPPSSGNQGVKTTSQNLSERPVMYIHQGDYFRYAMPSGWKAHETTNGVDMAASDEKTAVSFALLVGAFGEMTPQQFIQQTLRMLGFSNIQVVAKRNLPDQPGPYGMSWKIVEQELRYTYKETPVRGKITCGVQSGLGRYSAAFTIYQAPEKSWDKDKFWLVTVANSVTITNPRQVAGLDKVQLPRNHPLDNSALLESWRQKGLSEDRISQARREAMMGYEEVKSPSTGKAYDMPLETYDPTVHGYRNPEKPEEILVKPQRE